jgi:molybdate transport system substrate-binding protein
MSTMRAWIGAAAVAFAMSISHGSMTSAAEIKVISANGMREVIAETKAKFEAVTGHKLNVTVVETGEIRRRVLAGEPYDVVIVPSNAQDAFVQQNKVAPGAVPTIRVNFGLAVRADAPRPDTSTPDALKNTFLAAKTVLITDPSTGGISGVHLMEVLGTLGIAEAMKNKLVANRGGGFHAARVVKGEADLAVQAEHEIRCVPGAAFLDYPKQFQRAIVFMAGVGTAVNDAAAAKAYIAFLKGSEVAAAIKAHCLSPA